MAENLRMEWFIDIYDCCGCGACEQVCPVGCISMSENREGFLVPIKALDQCIQCGRCEKVCPVLNKREPDATAKSCYMCKTQDEQLLDKSSSGGVFTHLAEWVLDSGGIVFGAAFDEDWGVKMLGVEDKESLALLRGSKYMTASVGHTYVEALQALRIDRWVLYTGTPCQIAGLTHFLQKDYEKLLKVDIMCHGVPSPMVWKRYLKDLSQGNQVKNVSFRSKTFGWNRYALKVEGENAVLVHEPNDENIYMRGFLNNLYNRTSCAKCPARGFNNGSDLTIGDYWELENLYPEAFDNKGMSLVIVHTPKGDEWRKKIADCSVMEPVEFQGVLQSGNHGTLWRSAVTHYGRNYFFSHLDESVPIGKQIETALRLEKPLTTKEKTVKIMKHLLGSQYYQIRDRWHRK